MYIYVGVGSETGNMDDAMEKALLYAGYTHTPVQNPLFYRPKTPVVTFAHATVDILVALSWCALLGSLYVLAWEAIQDERTRLRDAHLVAEWCRTGHYATDEFVSCPTADRVARSGAPFVFAANVSRRIFKGVVSQGLDLLESTVQYAATKGAILFLCAYGVCFVAWPLRSIGGWASGDLEAPRSKLD